MSDMRITITNGHGEVFATHELPPMSLDEWGKMDFRWLTPEMYALLEDMRTACHRAYRDQQQGAPSE